VHEEARVGVRAEVVVVVADEDFVVTQPVSACSYVAGLLSQASS